MTATSDRDETQARASVNSQAQRIPVTVEDMFRLRLPSDPQLAPDGRSIAFVLAEWVADQPKQRQRIWMADANGGARPFTNGPRMDVSPRWSPDGRALAFISERDGDDAKPQLYVMDAAGGAARRVCKVPNGVADLAWSPDGSRLAFITEEGPEPHSDPIVVAPERHRRLWTVRPESDTPEPVTPPDLTVWLYAWASDSSRFALYFSREPGETAWYQGQLGLVAASGGAVRQIGILERQAAALAWSPDGRRVVYVSGEWSDRPLVGGDLWMIDVESGAARNLTPSAEVSVSWAEWMPDGNDLLVLATDRVWQLVGTLPSGGGEIRPLAKHIVLGDGAWPRVSINAARTRFAAQRTDLDTPPDIWLGDIRAPRPDEAAPNAGEIEWRRLTRLNAIAEETLALSPTEVISYEGADGWRIDALLTMPRETRRGAPPPLIVHVHGGPSGTIRAIWGGGWTWVQQWAAAGFAVLQPNFRGSLGRGVAFADAILGDMGGKDLEDVLRGVDYLVHAGRVDGDRVGIMGWSYGGFATAWAVTQTTRFKAAVMGAGICDFHSFHAQSNIPDWDRRFLRADLADNPDAYRARSSITYVSRVRTPTLIVHGEQDQCVPVNQAYAFHRALRERSVPAELVVYPREGHGPTERDHLRDLSERMVGWFTRYL
ncbi:MAG TPA: S9 family peptidase [Ktedonobacterales bacterium]